MSVFEYIVLSIALGIETLVVVRSCALQTRIRLTKGMVVSLIIALFQVLFAIAGMAVGNSLRFDFAEVDNLIYLGLVLVVAVKLLMSAVRKERNIPAYDISRWSTIVLLGIATSINALILALGLGFRVSLNVDLFKMAIPLFLVIFLFSFWAIMLGRQKVEIRRRRWSLFAVLFLLIFAIKGAFFN